VTMSHSGQYLQCFGPRVFSAVSYVSDNVWYVPAIAKAFKTHAVTLESVHQDGLFNG
jgi:hypothetical protein